MKSIKMIFFTLLSSTGSSYALPARETPRIYFCQNENLEANIYRQQNGQFLIVMEDLHRQTPTKFIKDNVSELSNKLFTIYTSDHFTLKIVNNPSGFMKSLLLSTSEEKTSKADLTCQLVYNI